jgi:hypothetical protein
MGQNGNKTILLIGDFADWMSESCLHDIVWFGESIKTRCALSVEQIADESVLHGVDVVAVDGFYNPKNTIAMVQNIRLTNSLIPMIAASSDQDHQKTLIEAGCNFQCPRAKYLPPIICGIFEVYDTM